MTIAIIDYGSGNLRSVAKAFEHVAPNQKIIVTSNANDLATASHIVLPGVGAFGDCMKGLTALGGMLAALNEQVLARRKNFLGICVGMQMMFERGFENGEHKGLGWLSGEVMKLGIRHEALGISKNSNPQSLIPNAQCLKVPHMGWNELSITREHPILQGIKAGDHAYFVHSYAARTALENIIATTNYGQEIPAIVGRDNIMGTQFHPEKSQQAGLQLIRNFISMAS